ncbi:MAG TPA: L-histidine N(alpha)-methyltransferase [Gemmatimonadaceae bacterium]|jgi:L-histidine N-alpha-methyltransferase|nr:L-histidine N(alpha)-methyltransferase [Gemmatimonadaceae bacterium]
MKSGHHPDVAGSTPPYTVRRSRQQMVRDVRLGLKKQPKELSSKYFYDERGSELFEEITQLPEYYLTRAERMLLEQRIGEIIRAARPCSLVELGAGSASKTRIILDEMRANGCAECYLPVDVSRDFLEATALQLRADYPDVEIKPVVSDITERFSLPAVVPPTLFAFLGSTIGNFPRQQAVNVLSHIAGQMGVGDRFLLGADLIKDAAIINSAYNDSRGVTAAFNLNVLERLNRELNADFPLAEYDHRAFYSSENHRVEMHLIARKPHKVVIPEIGEISFEEGESIRTELSYKYDRPMLEDILTAARLEIEKWMPASDGAFVLALAHAVT